MMIRTRRQPLLRTALAALALPLALGLAACGKKDDTGSAPIGGETLAKVAPPAGKAWSDVVAATPEGGMLMGNPNAPIKLVEYGSLSCPHCAKFSAEGQKPLVENYVDSGRVSWEYRSFAIHSIDVPLTVLVRCADPSAFFGLVEQLYSNQPALMDRVMKQQAAAQAAASLPPSQRFVTMADALGFTEFFAARGVSTEQAHACLAKPANAERVAKDAQTFSDGGIDSTPTLVINGTKTDVNTWPEIEALFKSRGAR